MRTTTCLLLIAALLVTLFCVANAADPPLTEYGECTPITDCGTPPFGSPGGCTYNTKNAAGDIVVKGRAKGSACKQCLNGATNADLCISKYADSTYTTTPTCRLTTTTVNCGELWTGQCTGPNLNVCDTTNGADQNTTCTFTVCIP